MVSQEEPSPGWILHMNHSCSKLGCCFPSSHREFIYFWLPTRGLGNACHGCFVTEPHGGKWAEPSAGSISPTPGWPPTLYISAYGGRKLRRPGEERAELMVLSRIWEVLLSTAEIKRVRKEKSAVPLRARKLTEMLKDNKARGRGSLDTLAFSSLTFGNDVSH